MKRSLVLLLVAVFYLSLPGFSQKPKVGLEVGATMSNIVGKIDGSETRFDSRGGYMVGLLVDLPIAKTRFTFRPEVGYVQKGTLLSKTKEEKNYWAIRYAEFQFNFLYHTKGAKNLSIFGGIGPSISFNLPSKTVVDNGDQKVADNLIMDKESPAVLRGIDYGVSGIAGLQYKGTYFLAFNYNHGIRNLVPGEDPVDELRTSCFAIKLGVLLNNK